MKSTYLPLIVLATVIGCSSLDSPKRQMPREDSWLTRSPIEEFINAEEENIIPPGDIYEVPHSQRVRAEMLLDKVAIVELSPPIAEVLLEKTLPERKGFRLFLVRGVVQNRETGGFNCIYYNKMLEVSYGAMGTGKYPIEKQAILVRLRGKPKKVFVTCSVME